MTGSDICDFMVVLKSDGDKLDKSRYGTFAENTRNERLIYQEVSTGKWER